MIGADILLLEKIAETHRQLYLAEAKIDFNSSDSHRTHSENVFLPEPTFTELIEAEQAWFENEVNQYEWIASLNTAVTERDRKYAEIFDRILGLESGTREISDLSRSLRVGVERQLTEQAVMESMVSEISGNLEIYRKFPVAQKFLEEGRVEEALEIVVNSLRFFRSHGNFQESEIFVERFTHLKAKILNTVQEISDSTMKLLRSEICDPEITEFLKDYERKFVGERGEFLVFEILNISRSLKEETASVRSFVRKFLQEISDLCEREKKLIDAKFGESEISEEIFRHISDHAVFELREVAASLGDDLEKLRDVIEQIGNSKKFPDPLRLGLGAFRKDLQERVAVSSVLNVRRGGGVRRTLEVLSLLVGILDDRTFQSVANEAVNVVLQELREKTQDELHVIGNLLVLREHVAMLECDLVLRGSEISFPSMQDLFSDGIWNILTPKISHTQIDVKAKIEDTLRDASKNFVARSVQSLLRPVVETGKVDVVEIGNSWKSQLPKIFTSIRLALSIGKIDSLSSGAALAGPLTQELLSACGAIDAEAAENLKAVVDECYAQVEAMSKEDVEQFVAQQ